MRALRSLSRRIYPPWRTNEERATFENTPCKLAIIRLRFHDIFNVIVIIIHRCTFGLRKHEGKQERENKLGKIFSPKNMLLPRLFILLVCFATLASAVRVAFIAGTLFIRFFFFWKCMHHSLRQIPEWATITRARVGLIIAGKETCFFQDLEKY